MNGLDFCPWLIWPINMVILAEGNLMLIDFCTKKTFFFINNEAQGGRKRSFGAKTHITRKRKQRAFQPMWSEISKSNTFREIFINICTNFCRGNPSLPASTIVLIWKLWIYVKFPFKWYTICEIISILKIYIFFLSTMHLKLAKTQKWMIFIENLLGNFYSS